MAAKKVPVPWRIKMSNFNEKVRLALDCIPDPRAQPSTVGHMGRPSTGTLVLLVGLGDILFVPVLFTRQLSDIGSAGVFASVKFSERAGEPAAAVWFAAKGVLLVMVGQLARRHERLTGTLPSAPGWLLAALGAAGVGVAPISGFWVYTALGALWISDSRDRARNDSATEPDHPAT